MSVLNPYEQFGHMQGMAGNTMSAFGKAGDNARDSYQMDAARSHQMAMQRQLLDAGIQTKQMDLQAQREKHGLLRGLLGGKGFSIGGNGR